MPILQVRDGSGARISSKGRGPGYGCQPAHGRSGHPQRRNPQGRNPQDERVESPQAAAVQYDLMACALDHSPSHGTAVLEPGSSASQVDCGCVK
jgi:hypothetical protein